VDKFEEKLAEICEVKRAYGPSASSHAPPHTTDEEVERDEEEPGQLVVRGTSRSTGAGESQDGAAVVPYNPLESDGSFSGRAASYMDLFASAIDAGSTYLSEKLERGSESFAQTLADTVEQAKRSQWLEPSEEEMKVNPLIKGTLYYGSRMSPLAVSASGALANGLVYAAEGLGKFVGQAVPKGKGKGMTNYAPVQSAIGIGGATARGVVSIWDALEKAGKTALDASSGATVSIVHHKYGAEAAKTVSQGLSMGTDLYSVSTNLRSLGPKSLAKKIARKTGVSAARTLAAASTVGAPQLTVEGSSQPVAIEGQPERLMLEEGRPPQHQLTIEEVD